jgi:hypothetical protein
MAAKSASTNGNYVAIHLRYEQASLAAPHFGTLIV